MNDMRCLLTINAGSYSLKTAVFREDSLERLVAVEVTGIDHVATMTWSMGGDRQVEKLAGISDHDTALSAVLERLRQRLGRIEWKAVGHRVTHGFDCLQPRIVDTELRSYLEALIPLAPLHQPHNLAGITAAERLAPSALQVACFDTSFHRTIPDVARRYALPRELSADGIEAYGFHGLSYEYIASILPSHLGPRADARVIVAHLGSGASMCAMRERKSVATTMGLTPLDGLPMATRSGALDPGVILYLLETRKMDVADVRDLLYQRSGLLGASGVSDSMKELLASADRGAAEAVELFVYRGSRAIGSLAAALGGLDALVFTGGIGENSAPIRSRIVHQLSWLGAQIDERAHADGRAVFSDALSRVSLVVLPTDEEAMIARHVAALLRDGDHAS